MVEEKLQQPEIRRAQWVAQSEVIAQPRIEIFNERAGTGNVLHGIDHGVDDALEFTRELLVQLIPSLPISRR